MNTKGITKDIGNREEHQKFIMNTLGIKLKELEPVKYKKGIDDSYELRNDSTTKALSKVLNLPYYQVLDKQYKVAQKYGYLPTYIKVTKEILRQNDYKATKFHTIDEISIAEFLYNHKKGKYIIVGGNHIFAYIDGVWYDDKSYFKFINQIITQHIVFAFSYNEKEINYV